LILSHVRGNDAEDACCSWLKRQGLKLLTRNYRSRRGELDLVMQDGGTVVFIEVRYRKNNLYLQQETRLQNGRFDVVAMTPATQTGESARSGSAYTFNWIKNAF
jgi:putative endonuclease